MSTVSGIRQDLAHISPDKLRFQTIAEHSGGVRDRAVAAAVAAGMSDRLVRLVEWAALLHDTGKYRAQFHRYLTGQIPSSILTQHAIYGAYIAYDIALPACIQFAVAGHHAGLFDLAKLRTRVLANDPRLRLVAEAPGLLARLGRQLPLPAKLAEFIKFQNGQPADLDYELLTRMLFSLLVDADYLDTEEFMRGRCRTARELDADGGLLALRALVGRKQPPTHQSGQHLHQIRQEILRACLDAGGGPPGFYTLTTPTGGGKTLSGLAFALQHARSNGLRRIIVVLPYLSIIEQNVQIYRQVLGGGAVVEHHSALVRPEEDDREQSRLHDQATENWDAPLVVTTSVQFLESMLARKPSQCRKLHNIARSVVILDEVQTLPHELLEPCISIMRALARDYGTTFLLCSATQPGFRAGTGLPSGLQAGEVTAVVPDTRKTFGVLQRVRYRMEPTAWSLERLGVEVAMHPQALVVLNLRRHAARLFEALQESGVPGLFHLSSAMCPAHRSDVLGDREDPAAGTIYHALRTGAPCLVISTQVIEAGVDIDFPVVFRALAPLDALIQAAGRCNREWLLEFGQMILFDLAEEWRFPDEHYRLATELTRQILYTLGGDYQRLVTDPELYADYHRKLLQWRPSDAPGRGKLSLQTQRRALNFEQVALVRVITDSGTAVVVPYRDRHGLDSRVLLRRVELQERLYREDLRRLQRFMVAVRDRVLEKVSTRPVCGDSSVLRLDSPYSQYLGVWPLLDTEPEV